MNIHILTRCTRTNNLLKIKECIFNNTTPIVVKWHVLFDTSILKDVSAELLSDLQGKNISLSFYYGSPGDYGHSLLNKEIELIGIDDWVYILDDDNILHEDFYEDIFKLSNNPGEDSLTDLNIRGFIFSQKVGGKDFSGIDIREASSENIEIGKIDMAQFLIRRDSIGFGDDMTRFVPNEYKADGYFIKEVYSKNSDKFLIVNKVLCYYNFLQGDKMPISLPRVLLLGQDIQEFKSKKFLHYEEDKMNKKFLPTDENINIEISKFNPDSIITIGRDFSEFPNMSNKSLDFRSRWLHFSEPDDYIGEISYKCSMESILRGYDPNTPLVSFFTPFYNTGDKLLRTYQSLKDQSYNNWEWVLVNDSSDEGKTLKIAEKLAEDDPRVKVYDFRAKSGGIIGESKYRAASLSRGKYIMELDHDDCLTPDAASYMVKAFQEHPDCKFVYSDCAEIDENYNSMTYGDGFSFGYGSYHKEIYNGKEYSVANASNINPKTIRHIVGVPNHFRSWDKEFYMSIGGHNRRLTIADDYELIIRTFLKTRMIRIPKLCYLQFFHNSGTLNNTQDSCRADIQRRVRTISEFYNIKIKERFNELGLKDWAYDFSPMAPLMCDSKFGDEENYANYIYSISNPTYSI